jgi:hypothetical protein
MAFVTKAQPGSEARFVTMLEYDPDKNPEGPSEELMRKAESLGLRIVQVVCLDDPDQEQGVPVTFDAMISVMPRAGDLIVLENSRVCKVVLAQFITVPERNAAGKLESVYLYPIIVAQLGPPEELPLF